jgi:hypothetical protein
MKDLWPSASRFWHLIKPGSETVKNPDPDSFRPQNPRSSTQNPQQTRPQPAVERGWADKADSRPPLRGAPLRKGGKGAQRNRDESAACARPTFHQLSLGLPIFWHPGNVVGLFSSLATVLPPLITTTRCRPPKLGLFACPIPPWFVLSCNLPTTNARAFWLCFGAFLSPPAPCLRLHRPQATIPPLHAPRSTLHARPAPPSAGTSGVRSCGDSSRWLLPDNNRRFATDRTQGRFILAF